MSSLNEDRQVFIFDLETDTLRSDWPKERSFEAATLRMHMTVGCGAWAPAPGAPSTVTERRTYWRHSDKRNDLEKLGCDMDAAQMIVIYNGMRFDMLVLKKYYAPWRWQRWQQKLFDPFRAIYLHNRSMIALNDLARLNALGEKTHSGLEAPAMWRDGRHDELERYCQHDVEILQGIVYISGGSVLMPRKQFRDVIGTTRFPMSTHTRARWQMIVEPQKDKKRPRTSSNSPLPMVPIDDEEPEKRSAAYLAALKQVPFARVKRLRGGGDSTP